jgi:DNA mismatch endonuclease (patch repair protein)
MASVPQANSKPEIAVRKMIHGMGFRFRIHRRDLPGCPDIVLPRLRKVIFVHGCFWHRHSCQKATTPGTNRTFWEKKFASNRNRDRRVIRQLKRLQWDALVIWECETTRQPWLARRISAFLRDIRAAR